MTSKVDLGKLKELRANYDALVLDLGCPELWKARGAWMDAWLDAFPAVVARLEAAEMVCEAAGRYRQAFALGGDPGFPTTIRSSEGPKARDALETAWEAWRKTRSGETP